MVYTIQYTVYIIDYIDITYKIYVSMIYNVPTFLIICFTDTMILTYCLMISFMTMYWSVQG